MKEEVFVGHSPAITYAYRILHLLEKGTFEIVIKARGKSIPAAVDTAEITMRLAEGFNGKDTVSIGTDTFEKDNRTINVSFIEILLEFSPIKDP